MRFNGDAPRAKRKQSLLPQPVKQSFLQWVVARVTGVKNAYIITRAKFLKGRARATFLYKKGYMKVPQWVKDQGHKQSVDWVLASRNKAFWG
jgi:hypothetical protein